jgi:predicted alpha/beta superfamily hydrolase
MPDGGLAEDFLHVAGLVQVCVGNSTMRPFVLVGIENTERRRDLTGPTQETAIVGESLAGLFVIETFLLEPALFDTYIAIDPSLWWNDGALVKSTPERLHAESKSSNALWFASSGEQRGDWIDRFASSVQANAPTGLKWHYQPMPEEKHSTIYHPAALKALRAVFQP